MAQNHPAFDSALTTGKVVIRRWWLNERSTKNQISVQFQQLIERDPEEVGSTNFLVGLAQVGGGSNKTTPTTIFSFEATRLASILGSTEGNCYDGTSAVVFANDLFEKLAESAGQKFGQDLAIEVTENFEQNKYSSSQQPKINPTTGEVVMGVNPTTNTLMPVYRHTKLVLETECNHTFVVAQREAPAAATTTPESQAMPFSISNDGSIAS